MFFFLQAFTSQSSSENDEGPVAKLAKYTDDFVAEQFPIKGNNAQPKRKSNGKSVINKSDVRIYSFGKCFIELVVFLTLVLNMN